ncbi:phospholipase A2-like [Oratosquilla oratoria]|uniref:phospholipase A2-like n=1 Tax=Oratosquilla oratoria TaxID=337810 RepID=UPI003F7669BB
MPPLAMGVSLASAWPLLATAAAAVLALAPRLATGVPVPGSYFTDESAQRLLHYDALSGDCVLFGDRRIVDEIMRELATSESPVAIVEAAELTSLISQCYGGSDGLAKRTKPPAAENFPHIIYPGTKWCGTGNVAEDLSDLGPLKDLDVCCRDHDLCPDDLAPGETRHNITNDSPFTMSHCDCNDSFRKCLQGVGSAEAREVGGAYFSTGLVQCFKLAKPIVGCAEWAGYLSQACQKYLFDENGEARWQVFDIKSFE